MKKLFSKIVAVLAAMALMFTLIPTAKAQAYDGTDKGTITITNVTDNNKFVGYKILNVIYNSDTNTVTYAWANTDIADAIGVTPEEFAALGSDSEEPGYGNSLRQEKLVEVANMISDTWSPELTEVTASNNVAEFNNVSIGGYLIIPTSTDEVYETMMAVVQPVAGENGYATSNASVQAKKSTLNIEKTVEKDNTGISEEVKYTIVADIPTYPSDAKDKYYAISDTLSDGLDYVDGSIVVKASNAEGEVTLGDTAYTFTKTDAHNFAVVFDYDSISSYTSVKIEYKAKINDKAQLGTAAEGDLKNPNTATLEYSHYPYVENQHSTDNSIVDVYTFGIKVVKTDAADSNKKLAGAEFDLYRLADGEDGVEVPAIGEGSYLKINDASITTGSDGTATFERLAEGTYYLVETKAPDGYTLPNDAFLVEVSRDNTDATGIQTKNIDNSTGFNLPHTGGTGTIIFTAVGVTLMLVAVFAFFLLRKRETSKN